MNLPDSHLTEQTRTIADIITTVEDLDQVAAAMEGIKKASSQNVGSDRELEASARSLEQVGQRLSELVGKHQTQVSDPGGPHYQAAA